MREPRSSINLCIILVCLYCVPVELATLGDQISRNDSDYRSEAQRNLLEKDEKVETSLNSQSVLDSYDSIHITVHSYLYKDRDCNGEYIGPISEVMTGIIEDNSIGFSQEIDKFLGRIKISPDSSITGFNVDFGHSKYSDGIQFHFNYDQLMCRNGKTVYQPNSKRAEICMRASNMKRGPGRQIRVCFLVGGAILSSQYYDINTINKYNGITANMTDFGCYTADDTSISHHSGFNDSLIEQTLHTIAEPLHNELCNSAYTNSPIITTVISSLIALIRFR